MIRHATHDDIGACLEMGRAFFDESGFGAETTLDAETTAATLARLVDSADGVLLVVETDGLIGMAGALAYPHYFNADSLTAQELFWWVRPESRGGSAGVRLLQALEAWAMGRGCTTITMVCLPIDSPAEDVYQRVGYRASERSYIKRL